MTQSFKDWYQFASTCPQEFASYHQNTSFFLSFHKVVNNYIKPLVQCICYFMYYLNYSIVKMWYCDTLIKMYYKNFNWHKQLNIWLKNDGYVYTWKQSCLATILWYVYNMHMRLCLIFKFWEKIMRLCVPNLLDKF